MAPRRTLPVDHPPFAALPVRYVTMRAGRERMAVHVAGRLTQRTIPFVCVPGYQRNMSDFTDCAAQLQRQLGPDWPIVLVDLLGRGRSSDRADSADYVSPLDAKDIATLADALGIGCAVFIGQGYGGQVLMALAADRPALIGGTVLIDAGPVSETHALVRLRNNLRHFDDARGETAFHRMSRQMLSVDYPSAPQGQLDQLTLRTHFLDRRGRIRSLFDPRLIARLSEFETDDVLVAQWPMYAGLGTAPLLLMRTQLTEQLRRKTFEEMMRRRRDAEGYIIDGQGSPALLDNPDDVRPIVEFVTKVRQWRTRFSNVAA